MGSKLSRITGGEKIFGVGGGKVFVKVIYRPLKNHFSTKVASSSVLKQKTIAQASLPGTGERKVRLYIP